MAHACQICGDTRTPAGISTLWCPNCGQEHTAAPGFSPVLSSEQIETLNNSRRSGPDKHLIFGATFREWSQPQTPQEPELIVSLDNVKVLYGNQMPSKGDPVIFSHARQPFEPPL